MKNFSKSPVLLSLLIVSIFIGCAKEKDKPKIQLCLYCLCCRGYTENKDAKKVKTENGHHMIKATWL